ncbi:MAG: hypothetical protein P4M12_03110 [Gammaproteobacteria bacterium]|nr:hypothetical protein [Gammaproteobacteria bacterium]
MRNETIKNDILGTGVQRSLDNSTRYNDEVCLESMRMIVKDYVAKTQQLAAGSFNTQACKNSYEELRQKIHDEDLKAYTAFEVMEKLYWQEYLIKK